MTPLARHARWLALLLCASGCAALAGVAGAAAGDLVDRLQQHLTRPAYLEDVPSVLPVVIPLQSGSAVSYQPGTILVHADDVLRPLRPRYKRFVLVSSIQVMPLDDGRWAAVGWAMDASGGEFPSPRAPMLPAAVQPDRERVVSPLTSVLTQLRRHTNVEERRALAKQLRERVVASMNASAATAVDSALRNAGLPPSDERRAGAAARNRRALDQWWAKAKQARVEYLAALEGAWGALRREQGSGSGDGSNIERFLREFPYDNPYAVAAREELARAAAGAHAKPAVSAGRETESPGFRPAGRYRFGLGGGVTRPLAVDAVAHGSSGAMYIAPPPDEDGDGVGFRLVAWGGKELGDGRLRLTPKASLEVASVHDRYWQWNGSDYETQTFSTTEMLALLGARVSYGFGRVWPFLDLGVGAGRLVIENSGGDEREHRILRLAISAAIGATVYVHRSIGIEAAFGVDAIPNDEVYSPMWFATVGTIAAF